MKTIGLFLTLCLPAFSTVITFDDLPARTAGAIPSGYGGLNWSGGFTFFDPVNYLGSVPSGYSAGIVSGPNIAYNSSTGAPGGVYGPVSFSSNSPFVLNSLYLTAAFNDNLQVVITGLVGSVGTPGYRETVILSATSPTQFTLNWSGLTVVTLTPSGGTQHPGYPGGPAPILVLDNLDVVTSPEPSGELLIGLLVLASVSVWRHTGRSHHVPN